MQQLAAIRPLFPRNSYLIVNGIRINDENNGGLKFKVDLKSGKDKKIGTARFFIYNLSQDIEVGSEIQPENLAFWFSDLYYVNTINEVRKLNKDVKIEILTPDFKGDKIALKRIVDAHPDVFNHNIETIERLYPIARQMANYNCSLEVLRYMKKCGLKTKSGFMLGLGESMDEIKKLILDLAETDLDIVTVGQYIQPSKKHLEVEKYYTLEEYKIIEEFISTETDIYPVVYPLARSSYKAFEAYQAISR